MYGITRQKNGLIQEIFTIRFGNKVRNNKDENQTVEHTLS